ncbi:MAG TPA: class I SAM-dependent methyltransferase [Acidobacteriota bacterium]|nr:class I SAM-dependent methyltransferase [Acidobacteriota bacterium]
MDPTQRFSNRVQFYAQTRPGYPPELLDFFRNELGLTLDSVIADIGSGTGILTEMFLRNTNKVYGVEPNDAMRSFAEESLSRYPNFISIQGTAEQTNLPEGQIDLIVAAQAFHWFDRPKTRVEFQRTLVPHGWVVLVWNTRKTDTTPFLRAYEDLIVRFGTDYKAINHSNITDSDLREFYQSPFQRKDFDNFQTLDFEGVKGRLLSSSYMPMQDHPNYSAMLSELERIFKRYCATGNATIEYDTEVYYGHLDPAPAT